MTRQCGDCQLCCKLLPVKAIHKEANTRCEHQRVGKGCTVYAKLWGIAPECKLWNCRWLGGGDDTDDLKRPDRVHYVLDIMPDYVTIENNGQLEKAEVVQIWVDPDYPDAHRDPLLRAWLERKNKIGLIRYGNKGGLAIIPPAMMDTGRWHEKQSNLSENHHSIGDVMEALGGDLQVEFRQ